MNAQQEIDALLDAAQSASDDQRNGLILEVLRSLNASGALRVARVTLTNAQIIDLPNTPVEIIPAPGAGFTICCVRGYLETVGWDVHPYANVANPSTMFLDGIGLEGPRDDGPTTDLSAFMNGDFSSFGLSSNFNGGDALNAPISLTIDGGIGAFTGGNASNTMTVTVFYLIGTTN